MTSARPTVTVVGLGPAGPDLVTVATTAAIDDHDVRFLRTARHPAAEVVTAAPSFDEVYDAADTFEEVYRTIADRLVAEAVGHGRVLYAVPGSPSVLERTVELLVADERVAVDVVPAMSFLELAWARLGIDPVEVGVRLVDGHRFATDAAGERGPLLVAHCHAPRVLSDLKLALDDVDLDALAPVTVLQRLGLPDETVTEVAWSDLDRTVEPDHLTSIYVPELAAPVGRELVRFDELTRRLRRECPWDREQTHRSLTRHLLEEAYETVEAIDRWDPDDADSEDHLVEELGDVLFQVFLHSAIATERGSFTLADVARTVHDKLVYRHPHVFGDVRADDTGTVLANWEQLKAAEKGRSSIMEGLPALPAVDLARKVQGKAAKVGFDFADAAEARAHLFEELDEFDDAETPEHRADELGDVLWMVVCLARHHDIDPETSLRHATQKFLDRFGLCERYAADAGIALTDADRPTLDRWWIRAKGELSAN